MAGAANKRPQAYPLYLDNQEAIEAEIAADAVWGAAASAVGGIPARAMIMRETKRSHASRLKAIGGLNRRQTKALFQKLTNKNRYILMSVTRKYRDMRLIFLIEKRDYHYDKY